VGGMGTRRGEGGQQGQAVGVNQPTKRHTRHPPPSCHRMAVVLVVVLRRADKPPPSPKIHK